MPFTRLRYHIVTATHRRRPLITDAVEPVLYGALGTKTEDAGGRLLEVGGIADHVHLLVALPPSVSVSDLMRVVKSGSCAAVRQAFGREAFRWQSKYSAFTVTPHDLDGLRDYVAHQKARHAADRLWPAYEHVPEPDEDG
jgi:REP element-mobilizing transposase RayT